MSEMIERMAKAMQASKAWPAVFQAGAARELARVALVTIREPTDSMASALGDQWGSGALADWQTMIDEALR